MMLLSLFVAVSLDGFVIERTDGSGGTTHVSDTLVLTQRGADGVARSTTFDNGDLPIFTKLVRIDATTILALGWRSFGGGTDSHVAWLISVKTGTPVLSDSVELSKPRPLPAMMYDTKGRLGFFFDGACPEDEDAHKTIVRVRGSNRLICRNTVKRDSGPWTLYDGTPSPTTGRSLRLVVGVKDGHFVTM